MKPIRSSKAPAVVAASSSALQTRLDAWSRSAAGALSPNTERALRQDTAIWQTWCAGRRRQALPAEPESIAAFVDAIGADRAPATVRRYVSSIATLHRAAGMPDPTKAEVVRLALKRLVRTQGARQRQARAITAQERDRMLGSCGSNLGGLRDAALLSVAYDTLARRSELVALELRDVGFDRDGSGTVLIRRSKTEQSGEGSLRYLSSATVRALKAWKARLAEKGRALRRTDPLFLTIRKGERPGGRLDEGDVARAFKRLAAKAHLSKEVVGAISGHSTRVGAAQDMVGAGIDVAAVMQAGGWKTPRMVARYSEKIAVKRGAAAKLAALQGRD